MKELKRKQGKGPRRGSGSPKHSRSGARSTNLQGDASAQRNNRGWDTVYVLFGLALACYLGYAHASHSKILHENELWFSHITQLEREISFRTEAGLYYSYYKQLVEAPSLLEGLQELLYDVKTESERTINIVKRFNVFQEIVLGTLYRLFPIQDYVEPVYFYMDAVFSLQAVYAAALFCTAWLLSGSLLGGALAFAFFFFNREDATRVEFAIPLRESFALPFIALQILLTSLYLRQSSKSASRMEAVFLWGIFVASLCVSLTWQFAQFIFLLEGLALLATQMLGVSPTLKVWRLLWCHSGALVVMFVLQFFNLMLLGSLTLSLTLAASVVFAVHDKFKEKLPSHGIRGILKMVAMLVSILALSVGLSVGIKKLLCINEDDHIFKFLMAKVGLISTQELRDFDSLLYLCQSAFQCLPLSVFLRLSSSLLLPTYLLSMATLLGLIGYWLWRGPGKSRDEEGKMVESPICVGTQHSTSPITPQFAYNVIQSVAFAVVAMSTQRFKYLWVPHMCVVAAAGVSHSRAWRALLKRVGVHGKMVSLHQSNVCGRAWRALLERVGVNGKMGKLAHLLGVGGLLAMVVLWELPGVWRQLEVLREFYDPDTVELMRWIIATTPQHAVFAGSMQLLAGVKLCTGRPITNHPHFENKELRERTWLVYQVYAKQSQEEVYNILSSIGTNYVILEDSICFAPPNPSNPICRLTDIMDFIIDGHFNNGPIEPTEYSRFCDAVHHGRQYTKHFHLVFENRTFRVYKMS